MNLDLIKRVIETSPPPESHDFQWGEDSPLSQIWEDENEDLAYWVDWREEDDLIPGYCEEVLNTGCLSAECVDIEEEPGFAVDITYKGKVTRVPLVVGAADRPITMFTLNQVLAPDYEVRYLRASLCTDGWCCVPLPTAGWQELEQEYGNKVDWAFTRITMPDLDEYARVEAMFSNSAPSAPATATVPTSSESVVTAAADPTSPSSEPTTPLPENPFGAGSPTFSTSHPAPGGLATDARRKSKILSIFLALFFGTLGLHRLYLGHYKSGLCMPALIILSHGVFLIPVIFPWILVDIYLIATGKLTSTDGLPLV